jgi:hypothetical protein
MLERLGQARWLQALADYEALLGDFVSEHGGTLVKAIGDGHLLAFPSARGALRCAVDVQRALPLASAPDLRVRMGMHTGEPAVGEADRLVLREREALAELLAGGHRLGHLLGGVDGRVDDLAVLVLVERVAGPGGEDHPRRGATAARNFSSRRSSARWDSVPGTLKASLVSAFTACDSAPTPTSAAIHSATTSRLRRKAQWPRRYRYDDIRGLQTVEACPSHRPYPA